MTRQHCVQSIHILVWNTNSIKYPSKPVLSMMQSPYLWISTNLHIIQISTHPHITTCFTADTQYSRYYWASCLVFVAWFMIAWVSKIQALAHACSQQQGCVLGYQVISWLSKSSGDKVLMDVPEILFINWSMYGWKNLCHVLICIYILLCCWIFYARCCMN